MRRLPGEPQHVSLDAERAEDNAGGFAHRFEHRPLFDVQLEVGTRVDRFQLAMRVEHPIERNAVLLERIDEPRALSILKLPAPPDDPRRLRPKRAPSSSAQSTSRSVTGAVVPACARSASSAAAS